jgi:hypothetical protein
MAQAGIGVRALAAAAVVVALALVLVAAPAAHAGCGGVQYLAPKRQVVDNRPPMIIGDSVLLGAMPQVAARGFRVNARGCRGWGEGHELVKRLRRAKILPHLVVMQLGTNWSISVERIRRTSAVMGPRRVLAVMTPREVGGFGGADARAVRAAGRRYPDRVVVLDWARATRSKPGWFAPDGIHLTPSGARGLGRFLRAALPYADKGARADRPVPVRR